MTTLDPAGAAPGVDLPVPTDIYSEPEGDADTLASLGPLRVFAGTWEGRGVDVHPVSPAEGGRHEEPYHERLQIEPVDFQTNGPQLLYGLRYHAHIVRPGEMATFHDQAGYWLWEPSTRTVMVSLAIPRGQVALAAGRYEEGARGFEVVAERGSTEYGIVSNPFLEKAFRTDRFHLRAWAEDDGTWSYEQTTTLVIPDRDEPFLHVDRNTLHPLAAPGPNPLAAARRFE